MISSTREIDQTVSAKVRMHKLRPPSILHSDTVPLLSVAAAVSLHIRSPLLVLLILLQLPDAMLTP